MKREFLKTTFWRLFSVEAEGERPVSHAIALMWAFGLVTIIFLCTTLLVWR